MKSIRQNLLLWLILGMLIAICIAGLSAYKLALDETNELFDYQIKQIALSLHGANELPAVTAIAEEDPEEDNVLQVWNAQGQLIYTSYPSRALPRHGMLGLHTVIYQQKPWRIFNTQRQSQIIQVSQPMAVRDELAAGLAGRMLIPFLLLIPLLAGLIWWSVTRNLRPLQTVANAVATRDESSMQALDETGLPKEIRPMVVAINQLLTRLSYAMQMQRTFIADAAHELRTPLTALKLQLALTERATTDAQRQSGFVKLNTRLERSIHLVKQLLMLTRSESRVEAERFTSVNLSALAQDVIQDLMPLAEANRIDLRADTEPQVIVLGQPENCLIVISNLLDNAIRYTPPLGQVRISVTLEAGHAVLRVIDNGRGIAAHERDRVFDRFYRCEGTDSTDVTGSGLGLAIVRNIIEAHHAKLTLSDNLAGPGLIVTVTFAK
jgi:two-component system, OmpR family, sensor kinase